LVGNKGDLRPGSVLIGLMEEEEEEELLTLTMSSKDLFLTGEFRKLVGNPQLFDLDRASH
jgi:hypothetical protein